MKIRTFTFLLSFFFAINLFSQENKIYNTQRTEISPHIDGMFDDKAWDALDWEGDFIQFEPNEGKEPSQKTLFKILYDDDNIYVAIRSLDNETGKIEKRLSRRDEWEGDLSGVHFDSYFDKRTSFVFAVSAAGVKNEGFFSNDGDNFDDSWDPIWNVKTKITTEGWNAEMEIPLSQLRFNNSAEQVWGLEVVRSIFRKDELSLWKPISKKESGWVSKYGELHGIFNIKPKKQIELAPFVVIKAEKYEKEEGNPFATGKDLGFDAGIDGKVGLTNDLILDFAINPDFGQVEADPSEVNLTAFETYFEEKRPFFIEGNNITNFQLTAGDSPWSGDNLFYSRRIGRSPRGYPSTENGEYVKMPENTKILAAFKVTGKTKKGWSIGIIESIANREKALIDKNGTRRKESVEPLTNYFIARLQKDINKGNAIIGGMITSTNRSIKNDELNFLPKTAISGGFDFTQYFKEKKYFVTAQLTASKISGTKESIEELQLSSRRYFQRPDADYLTFDPERTSLSGTGGTIMGGKQVSDGLRYLFNFTWRSPGLELNDIGFLREANTLLHFFSIGYNINQPFAIFRSLGVNGNEWAGWDFGGNLLFKGGNINLNLQFKNLWHFSTGINFSGKNISNTALRGGPAAYTPGNWNYWTNINSNSKKKMRGSIGMSINRGYFDFEKSTNFWGGITYRPINTLRFSLFPMLSLYDTELQYIDKTDFAGNTRYIFAGLNQKTFNVTMRVDVNITPDLTVQYYGSPFISSVLFDDFKRITDPKADNYYDRFHTFSDSEISFNVDNNNYLIDESNSGITDYSFYNPDFNFKQFRSNMVLRWEYSPGSTLFVVWSQGRTDYKECDCDFDFKENLKTLFKVTPYDVFLIKLSYRIRAEKIFDPD